MAIFIISKRNSLVRILSFACFLSLIFGSCGVMFSGCDSRRSSNAMQSQNGSARVNGNQTRTPEFKEVSAGKGTTKDGAPFSTQAFETEDGTRVSVFRENWDLPMRADEELEIRIKDALEIVERGPRASESGEHLGERVVAKFTKDGSAEPDIAILWTDGQQLFAIRSSSLAVALEFEKKFYR